METLNSKERSLISLLLQNDAEAFEEFYDKYAPAIFGLLILNVKESAKCSLLLQHIFLQFNKELKSTSFFPNGLFICLYRISLNTISEKRDV